MSQQPQGHRARPGVTERATDSKTQPYLQFIPQGQNLALQLLQRGLSLPTAFQQIQHFLQSLVHGLGTPVCSVPAFLADVFLLGQAAPAVPAAPVPAGEAGGAAGEPIPTRRLLQDVQSAVAGDRLRLLCPSLLDHHQGQHPVVQGWGCAPGLCPSLILGAERVSLAGLRRVVGFAPRRDIEITGSQVAQDAGRLGILPCLPRALPLLHNRLQGIPRSAGGTWRAQGPTWDRDPAALAPSLSPGTDTHTPPLQLLSRALFRVFKKYFTK